MKIQLLCNSLSHSFQPLPLNTRWNDWNSTLPHLQLSFQGRGVSKCLIQQNKVTKILIQLDRGNNIFNITGQGYQKFQTYQVKGTKITYSIHQVYKNFLIQEVQSTNISSSTGQWYCNIFNWTGHGYQNIHLNRKWVPKFPF